MVTTLRLPAETEALVERIAKRTGRSKSRVIRDAIALLAEREEGRDASPLDAISHLIGIVDSGGQNLSERTGRRFSRLVADRRRRAR
jgi:Arc/MetJ-type ribon-helix-helix transcriptional regulator